jgi:hypothetical protein
MIKRLFIGLAFLYSIHAFAQQPPIGVLPTFYNCGFAGEAGSPRIAAYSYLTAYRGNSQLPLYGNYVSYDNFLKKIRSGLSIMVGHSEYRYSNYEARSKYASMAISPKFSFNGKYTLAPFVRFNLSGGRSEMVTTDNTAPQPLQLKSISGSISSGVLFNSSTWYLGLTFGNLSHTFYRRSSVPVNTIENERPLKVNFSFHAGYTFQRTPDSKFSFTPQIILSPFRYRYTFSYTIGNMHYERTDADAGVSINHLNLMFRYKRILAGANVQRIKIDRYFFKSWNDPDVMIGYQAKKFRIVLNQRFESKYVYHGELGIRYTMKGSSDNGPVSIQ